MLEKELFKGRRRKDYVVDIGYIKKRVKQNYPNHPYLKFIKKSNDIATLVHWGDKRQEKDESGNAFPFIKHPREVMLNAANLNYGPVVVSALGCHDTIERVDKYQQDRKIKVNKRLLAYFLLHFPGGFQKGVNGFTSSFNKQQSLKLNDLVFDNAIDYVSNLMIDFKQGNDKMLRYFLPYTIGQDAYSIVDNVTEKNGKGNFDKFLSKNEFMRTVLQSSFGDWRIFVVKMIDRNNNIRSLGVKKESDRIRIATETEIDYLPLVEIIDTKLYPIMRDKLSQLKDELGIEVRYDTEEWLKKSVGTIYQYSIKRFNNKMKDFFNGLQDVYEIQKEKLESTLTKGPFKLESVVLPNLKPNADLVGLAREMLFSKLSIQEDSTILNKYFEEVSSQEASHIEIGNYSFDMNYLTNAFRCNDIEINTVTTRTNEIMDSMRIKTRPENIKNTLKFFKDLDILYVTHMDNGCNYYFDCVKNNDNMPKKPFLKLEINYN